MSSRLFKIYQNIVIEHPVISLGLLFLVAAFFAFQGPNFKLDASAESIVLENDQDLRYYRSIREVYGSDDFVIITYTPDEDLLSPNSLSALKSLRDELAQLERVNTVVTILDVPLLNSPKVSISELKDAETINTLETPGVDKELARKEFQESPIYRNNLVSLDGRTTALQVNFKRDEKYITLLQTRNTLREKKASAIGLTENESQELRKVTQEFNVYHAAVIETERHDIRTIRAIMNKYRGTAQLYLGGVRMITADMISFIEHDITFFGIGVVCFLILALTYFFRKLRWVALPMSCCFISVTFMVGFLGLLDWRVTVISSNFISLLLIITMSLTIHLIVRYRILLDENPSAEEKAVVTQTVKTMAKPCFYTAITTIVAFCSLVVSDIRPVIDFGWMMTFGILFAFALNFIYFPAVLCLLRPEKEISRPDATRSFTLAVAAFTQKHSRGIMVFCSGLAIVGAIGISHLEVDNRFIDHFKSSTEIYQGMELIDSQLGGTIPLDFVLDADADFYNSLKESPITDEEFEDPFGDEQDTEEITYWFNADRLDQIETIHDYLEQLPEVGKVLSIATGNETFQATQ